LCSFAPHGCALLPGFLGSRGGGRQVRPCCSSASSGAQPCIQAGLADLHATRSDLRVTPHAGGPRGPPKGHVHLKARCPFLRLECVGWVPGGGREPIPYPHLQSSTPACRRLPSPSPRFVRVSPCIIFCTARNRKIMLKPFCANLCGFAHKSILCQDFILRCKFIFRAAAKFLRSIFDFCAVHKKLAR
jgi:hypothetical protein